MRKTKIILIDDIDGSLADRTIRFSLNNNAYEIDLNEANAQQLETALAPFIDMATKVTRKTTRTTATAGTSSAGRAFSQAVRAWAKDQGIPVPDRGRVPNAVVEQYNAAHK